MKCKFTTISAVGVGELSSKNACPNPLSLSFEMMAMPKPFASISMGIFPGERRAGMPLFTLARAASKPYADKNLRVIRVQGDGKCMFRSIALGLARNQGRILGPAAEEQEADQLRLAVAEALCRTPKRRKDFGDAVIAVQAEDNLQNYCKRIMSPSFWGGEPELLVLSKMLKVPIYVYLATKTGSGYTPLVKYGEKYTKPGKDWAKRRPVRLLYSNGNHYDLLVK